MARLIRIKVEKTKDFTVIHNQIFRNPKASLKARGFYATVMTLPDSWDFTVNGMCKILKEGRHAIYATLKELESLGYVTLETERVKGKITEWVYRFTEESKDPEPLPENQEVENQELENPPQLNKQGINYETNEEDSVLPSPSETTERAGAADFICGDGLAYLTGSGIRDRDARSLLGKLRKIKGDPETAKILKRLIRDKILGPDEYIGAIFKRQKEKEGASRDERLRQRGQELLALAKKGPLPTRDKRQYDDLVNRGLIKGGRIAA
ncbi:MAG TPA: hypothetical protein VMM38_09230 [Aridibacter sp.]|nr:hypothetical protein [Aridibacter sp.]